MRIYCKYFVPVPYLVMYGTVLYCRNCTIVLCVPVGTAVWTVTVAIVRYRYSTSCTYGYIVICKYLEMLPVPHGYCCMFYVYVYGAGRYLELFLDVTVLVT